MPYTADPGGNFATDAHRRVMAALPNPDDDYISEEDLVDRLVADDFLDLAVDEVDEILADLEADGDANKTQKGWRNTKVGFEVLSGPIATDGGREHD